MRVILATATLHPNAGGPAYAVSAVGRDLVTVGVDVLYLTRDGVLHGASGRATSLGSVASSDLVHNFGIWTPFNHVVSLCARATRRPIIGTPMGMLEPWALSYKPLRKRLALSLYQRGDLDRAAALHATAKSEADNFRALGLRAPIATIPHGVDIPDTLEERSQAAPESTPRTALFMSRIHPKKGLLEFVQAWSALRPSDWRVVIAGPDEGNHRAEVVAAIRKAGLSDTFTFVGPVAGERKRQLLCSADLFVLPTFSENFGLVVPEALGHGVPVITTTGAPWKELVETQSGWWIEPGAEPLTCALREALAQPSDTLRAMGMRGRSMVQARYSWSSVIRQHIELYRWILEGGTIPSFVFSS